LNAGLALDEQTPIRVYQKTHGVITNRVNGMIRLERRTTEPEKKEKTTNLGDSGV